MEGNAAVIGRQLEAYNRHDLDGCMACFGPEPAIEAGAGEPIATGHDAIRARYAARFAANPDLRSTVLNRIVVGSYVIDDERLTGFADGSEAHVVLIYTVERGKIAHVRYLA